MQAMVLTQYGPDANFEQIEVQTPEPDAGQVLVRIAATSVNTVDTMIRSAGNGLPLSPELCLFESDRDKALQLALGSGEEYELCFTVPEQNRGAIDTTLAHCGVKATCIGQLRPGRGITLIRADQPLDWQLHGYDHFAE